jgi:hypothetical protein
MDRRNGSVAADRCTRKPGPVPLPDKRGMPGAADCALDNMFLDYYRWRSCCRTACGSTWPSAATLPALLQAMDRRNGVAADRCTRKPGPVPLPDKRGMPGAAGCALDNMFLDYYRWRSCCRTACGSTWPSTAALPALLQAMDRRNGSVAGDRSTRKPRPFLFRWREECRAWPAAP